MKNIFVSSSCIKASTIKESVMILADAGFQNIELSGGTRYYQNYINDLLELREKYNLNYQLHNYFPPPETPFVINLASLNSDLFDKTMNQCASAIQLSKLLGGEKYGIHAGFLVDIKVKEIGKKLSIDTLFNKDAALNQFKEAWSTLTDEAGNDVALYLENNVFSKTNSKTFKNNPFFLTDFESYTELINYIDFNLLTDIAHLKVSCNSLNLNFFKEADKFLSISDYIHVSDNDGQHDSNLGIKKNGDIFQVLKMHDLNNKTITIEVYRGLKQLTYSYNLILDLIR